MFVVNVCRVLMVAGVGAERFGLVLHARDGAVEVRDDGRDRGVVLELVVVECAQAEARGAVVDALDRQALVSAWLKSTVRLLPVNRLTPL